MFVITVEIGKFIFCPSKIKFIIIFYMLISKLLLNNYGFIKDINYITKYR